MSASQYTGTLFLRQFVVRGEPKGQPRPRAYAMNGKARVYDPGTAEAWKGLVAVAAAERTPSQPLEGPVSVTLDFAMPRPNRLLRKCDPDGPIAHIAKPDADNLAKAILDVLTQQGWWRNDSQVSELIVRKTYAPKLGVPGCAVTVIGSE